MSTREYAPDKWVIVEIKRANGDTHRRVFGSWYGGFTQGNSWKMSSGIKEVIDEGDTYKIMNESGSTYYCVKGCEGMSAYSMGVLASYQKQMSEHGGSIEVVEL